MLYDPNLLATNVTRYVGANRTFYILTEVDRVAREKTNVQVSHHKNDNNDVTEVTAVTVYSGNFRRPSNSSVY